MTTTTMPVSPDAPAHPSRRDQVLALAAAGRVYRLLDAGYRYLAETAHDPQVTLLTLKHLMNLGLGGPARELVDQRNDLATPELGIDVQALRKALSGVPTGRVPWEELQPIFEANLAALVEHQPHLAGHMDDLRRSLSGLQLFRSNDRRLHLSERPAGRGRVQGLRRWIPLLTDCAELADLEVKTADLGRAALIVGLGLNELVESVLHATSQSKIAGQQVPVFILEPDWRRLAAWLHTADRRVALRQRRVMIFGGPQSPAKLEQYLRTNDDLELPTLRFTCHVPTELPALLDEAVQRVQQYRNQRLQAIVAASPRRTDAQWAARLQPGARILGITSRFTSVLQYSMRDIGAAVRGMGYDFHQLMEADEHRSLNTLVNRRAVHELDPALVVLINHLRCESPHSLGDGPILSWFQDPIESILSERAGRSIGPRDFICGYYRDQCVGRFGYPPRQFLDEWVFPVSATMFHDAPLPADEAARLACDVMYVGHYHGSHQTVRDQAMASYPAPLHPLIHAIHERAVEMHRQGRHPDHDHPRALVDEAAAALGIRVPEACVSPLAHFVAHRAFDLAYRHQTLEWVGRWAARTGRRFRIYGKGWEAHPTLSRWAVGPVAHGEPLRRAFRAATLSVQSIHTGFWHQRSLEALASGSLTVARFSPRNYAGLSIEEYRRRRAAGESLRGECEAMPGLDRILFRSEQELATLADGLLADPGRRAALAAEMRGAVLREFTYEAMLPRIMEQVRARLMEPGAPPR